MLFTAIMETDCDNRIFIKSVRLFAAERVDWVRWIGCNQLNPQNGELPRARVPEAAIGNKDARKVMESYQTWFGEGPELSVIRMLGLFDRPAEEKAIGAC
jgi:hypothetical protein